MNPTIVYWFILLKILNLLDYEIQSNKGEISVDNYLKNILVKLIGVVATFNYHPHLY